MSIERILCHQRGVISRRQATAAGLTDRAVDHQLRRRRWRPLHPQIYLADGRPVDHEVRLRAALLWAGDGAVLVGAGAAWWHGLLARPPATVTVAVDRPRVPADRSGVRVLSRALPAADRTELRGLPLAGRPLAVLDAAVELGPAGDPLLDRALQSWLPFGQLHQAYRRNRVGQGAAGRRRVLNAAADRSALVARRLLARLLHDAGLPGWRPGPVGGPPGGLCFPAARVAVEVIGWARPVDERPGRADRHRAALTGLGWTVLRVTWPDLTTHPDEVLAVITEALPAR